MPDPVGHRRDPSGRLAAFVSSGPYCTCARPISWSARLQSSPSYFAPSLRKISSAAQSRSRAISGSFSRRWSMPYPHESFASAYG